MTTLGNRPRQLENEETISGLQHWFNHCKLYYGRAAEYCPLLKANFWWNPARENHGCEDEDQADDLKTLLGLIASHLPVPWLDDTMVNGTRNWEEVWNLLCKQFNIVPSQITFVGYKDITRKVKERPQGERMTVGLKNHITLDWLTRLDPRLPDVIAREYASVLRGGKTSHN